MNVCACMCVCAAGVLKEMSLGGGGIQTIHKWRVAAAVCQSHQCTFCKVEQRLIRMAGSPLGQPQLSPASGILSSYFFFFPIPKIMEHGWEGSQCGRRMCQRIDGYWSREMAGLNFFFSNSRIWLGLRVGTGESGVLFRKEFQLYCHLSVSVCACFHVRV